jgi:putative ABC transport system permease protein
VLLMVIRKMLNNRWLMVCLLIGSILAVAMVSSIPMYTDGVLQRMLVRDLQKVQTEQNFYPGRYYVNGDLLSDYRDVSTRRPTYEKWEQKVAQLEAELNLPTLVNVRVLGTNNIYSRNSEDERIDPNIVAPQDFMDHVTLLEGRAPATEPVDGVYEVVVNKSTFQDFKLVLDNVYAINDFGNRFADGAIQCKVVGVFTVADENDPYFFNGLWGYNDSFLMDYELFKRDFLEAEPSLITICQWFMAVDYTQIKTPMLASLTQTIENQQAWYAAQTGLEFKFPALASIQDYAARESQLTTTLWVLQVPLLLMLCFYIFMVSQLIVGYERNEITVFKSRGASSFQIVALYVLQSGLIVGIALIIGPLLGMFLCQVIGASNGFMEFVNRTGLEIALSGRSYLYALGAGLFTIITMVLPSLAAARVSVVEHKRKKSRSAGQTFWKKYFLDFILLAISLYGYYSYQQRSEILSITNVSGVEIPIDPVLFIISTTFIIGLGMVLLRLYPYVVRLIYFIGRKRWGAVSYTSLLRVSRSGGQEQFLMLFLILTLAIGLFSANAARTINNNTEQKVRYDCGADVIMQEKWYSTSESYSSGGGISYATVYREPDYDVYKNLAGVEDTTKVYWSYTTTAKVGSSKQLKNYLMAITPDEFGRIAYFPDSRITEHHWNEYLNLLASHPRACLVSTSYQQQNNAKVGDTIRVSVSNQPEMELVIFGFVDYWPTCYPYITVGEYDYDHFVIMNFDYLFTKSELKPYEVWAKMAPDATSQALYEDIQSKGLEMENIIDLNQQMIEKKNDPLLQGTNGALTLGFIVTLCICAVGFYIYWILSIKSRALQFGIMRAMGMTFKSVVRMLALEQVLISIVAILIGIVIGGIASEMFVPMLQMVYAASDQVPPFVVTASRADYYKVYAIVAVILTTGFAAIGYLISRIKISQAIKLGED